MIQLTVLAMMGAYFLMRKKPRVNEHLSRSLKWPRYLFGGLFGLIIFQIIPLPKFLVKLLSWNSYNFQNNFFPDFSNVRFLSLSLIPWSTLQRGLELFTYFLLGFLIVKTVKERQQIVRIFLVLIGMGIFQAFYGMFELYSKNPRILFYKKVYLLDSVTGTFVNRNHLSGYLEMIIPLAIGLIIARINLFSLKGLSWRMRVLRLSERGLAANLFLSFGVIIMSLGIIFSKSRSGLFVLVFAFILFFELTVLYFGRGESQKKWIKKFLALVFLAITLISLYVGIEATLERFSLDRFLREGRPKFWAYTMGVFKDFPLFGSGLGTFSSLYPDWETDGNIVHLDHAHNDYLEYLSELGVIGIILLLSGIFFLTFKSFSAWRLRRHPEIKGLALGGFISIICILLHSITDFNLHIPANTLLFSVVLSLTLVTAFHRKK